MSGMPWVRFFPSDWLAGSRGLSAAETGVYISLIAMMYERGEPLAEDNGRLARLCGASNSMFVKALETLIEEGKIVRVEGGLWNARVEKEHVYRSEKSEVGKQAAAARWRKDEQKQQASDADAMPGQCQGNANQISDTRYQKDNPATPTGVSPPSKRERGSRVNDFQPDEAVGVEIGLSPEQSHREAAKFRDYFLGAPGQKGVKQDWPATWRNWARRAFENLPKHSNQRGQHEQRNSHSQRGAAGLADHLNNVVARNELRDAEFEDRQGQRWASDGLPSRELSLIRGDGGSHSFDQRGPLRAVGGRDFR